MRDSARSFARARDGFLSADRFFRLTNEIRPDRKNDLGMRKSEGTRSSLCSVNTAFSVLRTLIPTEPADRKLSKIETLRLASSYISHLDAMLVAGAIDQPCTRLFENSGACSTRPQVCTFCLAMHKRYSFDISQGIPSYSDEETKACVYMPTNAMCFNLNVNDI